MGRGNILAVVGAQYGSEGKGVIVNHIANDYDIHVRVGGPQAGHSFWQDDVLYKMQTIPCGWTNPNADLYLGIGMLINPAQLVKEIEMIAKVDPSIHDRLHIDDRAGTVLSHNRDAAESVAREQRIGSTGEGVGEARMRRVIRDPTNFKSIGQIAHQYGTEEWSLSQFLYRGVSDSLYHANRNGQHILLEGSQGFGLSLIHGTWPYTTSHDTTAAQLAADVGISPRLITDIGMVARTYPIRVAGNSGPMYKEMDWDTISKIMGRPTKEMTTVTKRVRRIGQWDDALFREACYVNSPTWLAITFIDYIDPTMESETDPMNLSDVSRNFLNHVRTIAGPEAPIEYVGTGGPRFTVMEMIEWPR
jgi:adenylosuccinate synthase